MKALFTLKSAKEISLLFVIFTSATPLVYPAVAQASSLQTHRESALVFEIKDPSVLSAKISNQNQNSLTYNQIIESDPLITRLKAYLEKHNSPLAEYAAELPKHPQWQRALAISWVESNFGRRCANNNCSGIGVAPGHPAWRKYATKLDWFKDMCQLMEKPIYKEKYTTFKQMKGIYVYPGSQAWVNGATQKYGELMALTTEAELEKITIAANASLTTFPDLALLTK